MKKLSLIAIITSALITWNACAHEANDHNQPVNVVQSTTVKKTFKLKKYTQSCCTRLVEYGLKEVNGYIKSVSNTDKQQITVWYDSAKCSEKDIVKALNSTGYSVIK